MNNEAEALMQLFVDRYYPDGTESAHIADYKRRSVFCTPFQGDSAEAMAGWVVCVDGSPPKGTLVIFRKGPPNSSAYYLYGHSPKHIMGKDPEGEIIRKFVESNLVGKTKAFTII
jgi:hypothetical protein